MLPEGAGVQLGLLPEVDAVSPMIARPLQMSRAGGDPDRAFDIQLVGYDPASRLGGPLAMVEGKSPPGRPAR